MKFACFLLSILFAGQVAAQTGVGSVEAPTNGEYFVPGETIRFTFVRKTGGYINIAEIRSKSGHALACSLTHYSSNFYPPDVEVMLMGSYVPLDLEPLDSMFAVAILANTGEHYSNYFKVRAEPKGTVAIPKLPGHQKLKIDPYVGFSWSPVNAALRYHLQVATADNFSGDKIVLERDNIDATGISEWLPVNKIMYWRVRASLDSGWSKWGPTAYFSTAQTSGTGDVGRNSFSILPNPVRGSARVLLPEGMYPDGLRITDASGRDCHDIFSVVTGRDILIRRNNAAPGLYFLVLSFPEHQSIVRPLLLE